MSFAARRRDRPSEIVVGIEVKFGVTIFVDNGLDQEVTVQVKANRDNAVTNAVDLGSSFAVSADGSDARTLTHDTSGWLPWLYVEVSCATAPTSGELSVYLVRGKGDEDLLVDSLAIRDTTTHTPTTDPTEILIQEW